MLMRKYQMELEMFHYLILISLEILVETIL